MKRWIARNMATVIMVTFGLMLPLWYRLWAWATGSC